MKTIKIFQIIFSIFFFTACVQPSNPPLANKEAPEASVGTDHTEVLIYGGPGSWKAEIDSLKTILYSHGVTYQELKPSQFNDLSLDELSKFKLVLFAGGDAPTVREALSVETRARIREAVQQRGLNYLGFCAGAWLAVAPAPAEGEVDVVYGLGVVNGPLLELNYLAKAGRSNSLDQARFPDGSQRKLLWYGGPITVDLPGTVLIRYSDGTAAASQVWSGKGLVIMSGLHPAADKPILNHLGLFDREAIAPEFAWSLIEAAIYQKPLPTFP